MNRIKNSIIALASTLALVAVVALATPRPGYGSASGGSKDVVVVNTDANPGRVTVEDRPVRTTGPAGATPFQVTGHLAIEPGHTGAFEPVAIPAGKDLVVEFVSATGLNFDQFSVQAGDPPGGQFYSLPLTWRPVGVNELVSGSAMTQFVLHDVYVNIGRVNGEGGGTAQYMISGYLVDE